MLWFLVLTAVEVRIIAVILYKLLIFIFEKREERWYMKETIIGVIIGWLICMIISWLVTCGLIWIMCKCFSWIFSWKIATGIWIAFLIAKWIFSAARR